MKTRLLSLKHIIIIVALLSLAAIVLIVSLPAVAAEDDSGITAYEDLVNLSELESERAVAGQPVTLSFSAAGGTDEYSYACYVQSDSSPRQLYSDYSSENSIEVVFSSAGWYTVTSVVHDSSGKCVSRSFDINVTADLSSVLMNRSDINIESAVKGASVRLNGRATGGIAPYLYSFSYSIENGDYISLSDFSKNSSYLLTPDKSGNYTIRIGVMDQTGKKLYVTKKLTVSDPVIYPLENQTTISSEESLDQGSAVSFSFCAADGVKPYEYSLSYRLDEGEWQEICSFDTMLTEDFILEKPGKYEFLAAVRDAAGTVREKQFSVSSIPVKDETQLEVCFGLAVTISAADAGPDAQYAFSYRKESSEKWTTLRSFGLQQSVSFRPREFETYIVKVETVLYGRKTSVEYTVTPYLQEDVMKELELVNSERAANGLPEYSLDYDLIYGAAIRAEEIEEYYSHYRPDGSYYDQIFFDCDIDFIGSTGENIGKGYQYVEDVLFGWLHSQDHKNKILSPKFTKIGMARNGIYWTQLFCD